MLINIIKEILADICDIFSYDKTWNKIEELASVQTNIFNPSKITLNLNPTFTNIFSQ